MSLFPSWRLGAARHRRWIAALVVLSLGLQLLAATVGTGHWARQIDAALAGQTMICTATGMVSLGPDGLAAASTDGTASVSTGAPCPFCLNATACPPLVASAQWSVSMPPQVALRTAPPAASAEPGAAPSRRMAQPRAPPGLA